MSTPIQLKNYMKGIAVAHPIIAHSDVEGQEAFAIDRLEDLLEGKFKTQLRPSGVGMRFIHPMFRPFSDEAEGMNTLVESGFSIIERVEDLTATAIESVDNNCFRIMKEVIARITYDSRQGNSILGYSLNQLQQGNWVLDFITFKGDGYYFGYLATFNFQTEYITCVEDEVENVNWADL